MFRVLLCTCAGGRKGKGRGGGGGGRGVRGVDFGLGIGYSAEPSNPSSNTVPNRSATVNSLRTGMMSQFKSSFVAASPSSQNQGFSGNTSIAANKRPTLSGFVSGGSIGGDISKHHQPASQNQGFGYNTNIAANTRPTLAGFVSGGSIGGDINTHQQTASYNPATSTVNSTSQSSGVNPAQNTTNRLIFYAELASHISLGVN